MKTGKKHALRVRRWRLMLRCGSYRWAVERRPAGTFVVATPLFIVTALRCDSSRRNETQR